MEEDFEGELDILLQANRVLKIIWWVNWILGF